MSVYEVITERVVTLLEQGTVPWRKPWRGGESGHPRNGRSKRPYRGINAFLLATAGYGSPEWLTFKQARELGGCVRKGEKAMPVIFWSWIDKKTGTGEAGGERWPLLKYFSVFNREQCDGLPESPPVVETPFEPLATCETVIRDFAGAPLIEHREARAYYRPSTDTINLPRPELFETPAGYYGVAFHELTHSTGAEKRLARKGITDPVMFRRARVLERGARR